MDAAASRPLTGGAAVIGVGASAFGKFPEQSVLELAGDALAGALDDAGIEKDSLDGLFVHIGSPRGADYDTIAQIFGLNPRFCGQTWAHGRFAATVLMQAALAVCAGLADRVACVLAMKNSNIGRLGEANNPYFFEQYREGGGPHLEEGYLGMTSPVAGAALGLLHYCRRYGQDRELLAAIPTTFRTHAGLNPSAIARKPLTADDYRVARPIIDPLRLFDCSLVNDGAVCVIVTRRDLVERSQRPVWFSGAQGLRAGRDSFVFGPTGLGVAQQSDRRMTQAEASNQQVYQMAGCGPDAVDVLGVYDSFSPLALYCFEEFGFCGEGEALPWIQNGTIGLGGRLPTNTAGGQLSEAHLNGWGQIRELVLQLRGEAQERQVAGAKRALWATICGDALMFERG